MKKQFWRVESILYIVDIMMCSSSSMSFILTL